MVLHNIPEGFAISVPWVNQGGRKWTGLLIAAFTGLCELIGGVIVFAMKHQLEDQGGKVDAVQQTVLYAITGGIMTYISMHELYPRACAADPEQRVTTPCLVLGMALMAVSLS